MTSLFELFKIGIGPSSSHTVAPMRAANAFLRGLQRADALARVARVQIDLYGSLALTGIGHGTDSAVITGLAGETPDAITPERHRAILADAAAGSLTLAGSLSIAFDRGRDLLFHKNQMYPDADVATHPNGVRFSAFGADGAAIANEVFYSIGGGFIVTAERFSASGAATPESSRNVPYNFHSAAEMLAMAAGHNISIADVVLANEVAMIADKKILRPQIEGSSDAASDIRKGILALWNVMDDTIQRGIANEGILPGGLNVRRRAPRLSARLREK